jgi:hypothetical protein
MGSPFRKWANEEGVTESMGFPSETLDNDVPIAATASMK